MNSPPQSATTSAATPATAEHARPGARGARRRRLIERAHLRHAGLALAVALSAVMNTNRLSQNGYANIFYSAGVKSMLRSLHNFLFVSFDPGGLITVDKPPLALWVQAASAKVFGFSPLSLLLPQAIASVLAVALLYVLLARRMGTVAAFAGALALAIFPSFVAVSRANGVDPILILLLVIACGLALRATETGRWRWLIACAVVVGLAFNTKTLAAYLVVPGIAVGYLVCAPGTIVRRTGRLAAAGLVMLVVSFAWIAFVELTPASQRPYVGSSTNNSELGLTFEYNGLGRVEGQRGGPNTIEVKPGGYVPPAREREVDERARAKQAASRSTPPPAAKTPAGPFADVKEPASKPAKGREVNPIPFGGAPGPLRLFGIGLGDQAGWMLPFALFGLLAVALLALLERRAGEDRGTREALAQSAPRPSWRRDPRVASVLVLGGWFLVEAAVLSVSKGIVHPYYVSALAPGSAAMAGAGAVAIVKLARGGQRRLWGLALMLCAVAATVLVQVVLLEREHYMLWFIPVLIAGTALGALALLALRRLAAPAVALTFLLLLVAPTAYAATTWLAPVEATFPAAGPKQDAGDGGYGLSPRDLGIDVALADYVSTHRPGRRWELLTVASDTAAPMILFGLEAGALAGYSGTDPALDGAGLARLVARGEARYVLLGGEYSDRGGNAATKAVLRACTELPATTWHSPVPYPFGLVLFDCKGHERALARS